ncbi:phosphatase PAP2 family protein [Pontibacter liquoris]|uniref:phosphatase PAP2 family protein n=1 Tax=Pontibacter liquoris TaxID=2905677 RepID=UPI001FA7F868|nr:phosphatase PAP2 family protein [Pontibacter liquoris]
MKLFVLLLVLLLQLRVNAQSLEASPAGLPLILPGTSVQTVALPDSVDPKPASRKFLHTAALATAGAGLWLATFALADEPVQQFTQSHQTKVADAISNVVEPLGHSANMSPFAVAALAGGLVLRKPKLTKVGAIALGSIAASATITDIAKNSFHRHRPSATTENHVFDGPLKETDNTSLPSAHTTAAFAVATSIATVYGDHPYVAPVAYGVATLVGLSRINDNAHWTTDVIAGAAVGYFSAKGVSALYKLGEDRLHLRRQRLLVTPQLSTRSAALSATLTF